MLSLIGAAMYAVLIDKAQQERHAPPSPIVPPLGYTPKPKKSAGLPSGVYERDGQWYAVWRGETTGSSGKRGMAEFSWCTYDRLRRDKPRHVEHSINGCDRAPIIKDPRN